MSPHYCFWVSGTNSLQLLSSSFQPVKQLQIFFFRTVDCQDLMVQNEYGSLQPEQTADITAVSSSALVSTAGKSTHSFFLPLAKSLSVHPVQIDSESQG